MNEIIFLVEEAPDGGYTARALGESIRQLPKKRQLLFAHKKDAKKG